MRSVWLQVVVKRVEGSGEKVRRAQILVKADADDPSWTDQQLAEAFSRRTRTVKGIRERRVERRFQEPLDRA